MLEAIIASLLAATTASLHLALIASLLAATTASLLLAITKS
jgi:hypothetical protein